MRVERDLMKREFLTGELGLSKEITEKIMAQYGESVNSLKKENERLTNENTELTQKITVSDELEIQVEELTKSKIELTQNVENLEKSLNDAKFEGTLSSILAMSGAKNIKAVSALINREKINLSEDVETEIKGQIETIKNECEYLFYDGGMSSGMRHGVGTNNADGFTSMARAAAKL